MDNKLVVGVGNIYASRSLFAAGIHPDRLASSLSAQECELLVNVIKAVLQRSIEQGGTTLKDFLQSDGKPGYFAQELQVYGRKGEACRVCGTPIVATKHAQRATFTAASVKSELFEAYPSVLDERCAGRKCVTSPAWRATSFTSDDEINDHSFDGIGRRFPVQASNGGSCAPTAFHIQNRLRRAARESEYWPAACERSLPSDR